MHISVQSLRLLSKVIQHRTFRPLFRLFFSFPGRHFFIVVIIRATWKILFFFTLPQWKWISTPRIPQPSWWSLTIPSWNQYIWEATTSRKLHLLFKETKLLNLLKVHWNKFWTNVTFRTEVTEEEVDLNAPSVLQI